MNSLTTGLVNPSCAMQRPKLIWRLTCMTAASESFLTENAEGNESREDILAELALGGWS